MSERRAGWSKVQRDKAKADGKGLIAVDIDGKHGRWTFWGLIDHELATQVWMFANHLYRGKSPREAFDEVWPEGEAGP